MHHSTTHPPLPTLAVCHFHSVTMNEAIVEYLQTIDATLAPFGGRFVVHGGPIESLEGNWQGPLVILSFPDRESARAWYRSDAYQAILPLRLAHSHADTFFIDMVHADHRATDILDEASA